MNPSEAVGKVQESFVGKDRRSVMTGRSGRLILR